MTNNIFFTQTFSCLVRDRDRVIYEGKASAISTYNEKGLLDVLPEHTNFISIIHKSVNIIGSDGKTLNIPISKGILKVFENEARIYLGIFSTISKTQHD